MTREEYLTALKNATMALTSDEQAEALQYYSDYFEEANDDEKIINELGSPEELGKSIVDKFANAVVSNSDKSDKNNKSENDSEDNKSDSVLCFSYNKKDVKNLSMNFGVSEVVIISGKKFEVETRGVQPDDINCYLGSDGTLYVNNVRKLYFNFLSHDRNCRIVPRILVTVPEDAHIDFLRIKMGAGDFRSKNISLYCNSGEIEVGAGNLMIGNVYGGSLNFRCGMGNLDFSGSVTGKSNIDCGMGCLKMDLKGSESDYSYDLKLGLGDFKLNNEKKSGFYQNLINRKKLNHFSVNCGMGSVGIKIK